MIALFAIAAVALAADRDGDGITGHDNLCPRDAETRNGFKDGDGCADGGIVEVRVLDTDGKPVNSASITIELPAAPTHPTTRSSVAAIAPQGSSPYAAERIPAPLPDRGFTDTAGTWTATGLAPGERVVIVTAGGHAGRHDVVIVDGATADVIVTVGP